MDRKNYPAVEPAFGLRPAPLVLFTGLLILCQSCGSSSAGRSETSITSRTFEATVQATANPLVAQYAVTIAAPGSVVVEFGPDQTYQYKTSVQPVPTAGGTATLLVAGMKADSTYHLRALVTYSDGSQQLDSDHVFQTGTIPPQRIPAMKVTTSTPGVSHQGWN